MITPAVTVVDYGLGNLLSVSRALEHVGARVQLSDSAAAIAAATHLVLPGVGAFRDGMSGLQQRDLIEPLRSYGRSGRPFLGICLGMQLLFEHSEEFGRQEGLGLIAGGVVAIPEVNPSGRPHKIPHIGWNELRMPAGRRTWEGSPLAGLAPETPMYFVHSFTADPAQAGDRLADCDYDGCRISAAVGHGSLYGCQFHPEKSGPAGLRILESFVRIGLGTERWVRVS
jgi:glutamine amidotransferase